MRSYFIKSFLLSIFLFSCVFTFSQRRISGYVYNSKDSSAISLVDVYSASGSMWTVTDKNGFFEFPAITGKIEYLIFSRMGYVKVFSSITNEAKLLSVYLSRNNYHLKDINVTASRLRQQKLGSVIHLNRSAIESVQSNNLGDILKLLPGRTLSNPDNVNVSQSNFRFNSNVGSQYSNANAFGTSIIIDGSPVSNNAGMQSLNSANGSSVRSNSSVNRGIDLRTIPTNSIESIEIIEGIAGVRYGDISSGAIIITNKSGNIPLSIRSSINDNAYSLGFINSAKLSDRLGYISYDFDYLRSVGSPIDPVTIYDRVNLGARWTYIEKLSDDNFLKNTINIKYASNIDAIKNDPDARINSDNRSINNRFSISNIGKLQINRSFLKALNYNFSFSNSYQKSEFKERKNYDGAPILDMNLTGTYFTRNLSGNFVQEISIIGNPINFYSRVEALAEYNISDISNTLTLGLEYKYDANKKGKKAFSNASVSSSGGGEFNERNLDFENLPSLRQYSVYLQNYMLAEISSNLKLTIEAGLRYDRILSFNLLSPRINLSLSIGDKLNLRAGYGIFHKSPSIAQLYPKSIYLDKLSKSYYHSDADKRFSIISTYKIDKSSEKLKSYKGISYELGADFNIEKWSLSLNGYFKENKDGIYSNPRLFTYNSYIYGDIHSRDINNYTDKLLFTSLYGVDVNNLYSKTKGFDLMLSTPRIEVISTSFNFQTSVISTQTNYSKPRIRTNNYQIAKSGGFRYGEYEPAKDLYVTYKSSLMAVHHIPETGFLISIRGEFFWKSVYEPKEYNSLSPLAYYDRSGLRTEVTESMMATGNYDDLLIKKRDREKRITPFYTNFHLRITKETSQGHRFSFYSNNFLWNRPRIKNGLNYMRMNQEIFYGIDIILKISKK